MSRELLQQALDALEWLLANIRRDAPQLSGKAMGNAETACTALRAALAAPQPEPDRRIAEMEQLCAAIVAPPKEALDAFQKAFVAQLGKRKHYKKGWEDSAEIAGAKAFVATIAAPIIAGGFAAPPAAPAPSNQLSGNSGALNLIPPADMVMVPWSPQSTALDAAAPAPAMPLTDADIDRIADAVPVDQIDVHITTWHRRFARAVLSAAPVVREPQPLVEIRRRATPCGECHLQPGERCDICGARAIEQAHGIGGGGNG